jgi:tetratricopeptide (TPR) repeat protein
VTSRFRILGRTRLLIGDRFDDQWAHSKVRGILAVLLLHPGRSIPMSVLIDWVWPDGKEPRDQTTLHTYKKRLVEALARMAEPPRIISDRGAYRIEINREEVDFFAFQDAADRARTLVRNGDHDAAVQTLAPALDLWTDTPLADLHGERAENWRQWAQSEHVIPAIDVLLQALSALGRHREILHRLDDLPVEQQQKHILVKRRLEALHGSGRYQDAQAHYLTVRRQLKADFDDDTADALKDFYDNLTVSPEPRSNASPVAAEPVPQLLPHDTSHFTGRESLLSQLDAMATKSTGEPGPGIVMLNGPPGVGKTTLAVHWAHRVADRFPGGRLYVDMCGFADGPKVEPTDVIDGFLAALDFPVERIPTSAGRSAKLRSLLTGRRVLAILDNVASSNHVFPLLACLSSCLVVITSRRRLIGITRRGGLDLPVPPLEYSEAKAWLAHRVGNRATTEPDAFAELTAMCAGSPLAICGVADHVTIRPRVRLTEFVEELRDARTLLGLGDDGDGSDSNIRTVFSWSYRALAANEQQLFRVLGLHPGSDFDLDAAAALAGRDRVSTRQDLDALVNAHLLTQPESRVRYRFHDLFRKYAAECGNLDEHAAERAAARARLLSFYLHSANNADVTVFPYRPRYNGPSTMTGVIPHKFSDHEDAIGWSVRERANLNAVIRYAITHGFYEYVMKLANSSGEILLRLGYHEDAIASLSMAIQSAREVGETQTEADFLGNLAFVYLNRRELNDADRCLQMADEIYSKTGYQTGSAMVMHHRARLHGERGQFDRAIRLYHDALNILQREDATGLEIITRYRLSEAYRRAGNMQEAMTSCRDGLWRAEQVGDQHGQALCLGELARVYYEHGDVSSAKSYCGRAFAAQARLQDLAQVAKTYNLFAIIHRDEGDLPEAERCARQGLVVARAAHTPREEGAAYQTLGYILHERAQSEDAVDAWVRALTILDDMDDPLAGSIRAQLNEVTPIPPQVPASRTEPFAPKHRGIIAPHIP